MNINMNIPYLELEILIERRVFHLKTYFTKKNMYAQKEKD